MNKLLFTAVAILALASCRPAVYSDEEPVEHRDLFEVINSDWNPEPYIVRDKHTGCQYLMYISGGLTPRMNADGTQFCDPVEDSHG